MGSERGVVGLEKLIVKEIDKLGLSESELRRVLKNLKDVNPRTYKPVRINTGAKRVKFGVVSDMHMGHRCYRPDVWRYAAKIFKHIGVDFIVCGGDSVEGMSGRDGHVYELSHIGASAQLSYFEKEMKVMPGVPFYSIEADSSHGGWFKSKGNMGLDVGPELESRASNYVFLGYDEQDLVVNKAFKIRLRHPGGGTAYAISYKMQKYVESLGGGAKPNLVVQGHFHKAEYLFYRNVHCFDAGTVCDQTPFMKKKGTPAHVGFWVVDVGLDRKGVVSVRSELFPFYD